MSGERLPYIDMESLKRFKGADEGQDLLEYAFLASLISVFVIGAVTLLGQLIDQVFWQAIAASL